MRMPKIETDKIINNRRGEVPSPYEVSPDIKVSPVEGKSCTDKNKGGETQPLRKDLPEGWILKPIGEVCNFEKGKKPKSTGHRSDTRRVPYINIKAFETGTPEEYAEPGRYPMCSKDDVLIVWDGARSGLAGSGVSGYVGSTLSKVWSHETDNKYLFYFLKSQYSYINTNTKGVGIPHVDPGILNAIEIPIAPLNQQKLIVAEIEKQFSRLDEAVIALKRIQSNLKRYKASVLKAAVEGKLTEEWRSGEGERPFDPTRGETGAELLKRILADRKKKWEEDYVKKYVGAHGHAPKDDLWKKKYKEPSSPDTLNLPKLPKGWAWATVDQLAEVSLGKMLDKIKHRSGHQMAYLRNSNIRWDRIDTDDLLEMFFEDDELERYGLRKGDVLVCEGGEPGRAAVWDGRDTTIKYQKALHRVRIICSFNPRLLIFVLKHLANSGKLTKWFTGSTIKHFTRESFIQLPIPLSPDNEQEKIIGETDRHLSLIEELEAAVAANLKRAARLRQAILKKAFEGRLTKQ